MVIRRVIGMRTKLMIPSSFVLALASFAVLLAPEAALAFCVEDGVAGTSSHILMGVVGTLILAVSVGGLFGVLRKARAENRPEVEASDEDYQLPGKAVTS